jgi:hypothetical protein
MSAFTVDDIQVLRRLAARVRNICDSDENLALKQRWADLNDLKHSGPPLLFVYPEGSWREIIPTFPVECEDEQARRWEINLRKQIYQHDVIRDDAAFDPVFSVDRYISESDYGIPFKQSRSNEAQGAYHDEPVLTDLDGDLDKLHFRTISVDHGKSQEDMELALQALGDLLNVRFQPGYWWTCGLTWTAIRLWGLENLMMSMYDNPEGVHRLMQFLSEEMLNYITFFEREELLGYNAGANVIGSGGLGCTTHLPSHDKPLDGPVHLKHMWGFAESQETVGVSPDMFGEFIFPYQRPLLERFGLNYYGCCEASEGRWEHIRQTPKLDAFALVRSLTEAEAAVMLAVNYSEHEHVFRLADREHEDDLVARLGRPRGTGVVAGASCERRHNQPGPDCRRVANRQGRVARGHGGRLRQGSGGRGARLRVDRARRARCRGTAGVHS